MTRLFGKVVYSVFWRLRHQTRNLMSPLGRRFDWGASLYYLFCSDAFRREQRAVLDGKFRYRLQLASPTETSALLRRNTHRLEKGLLMRPRRKVFALDYIDETVECYRRMVATHGSALMCKDTEIRWAHDVLTEYFSATIPDPRTDSARAEFIRVEFKSGCQEKLVPYRRSMAHPVQYEHLLALAKHRRSVRWFLDRPVPRELIDRAIAVAALSPSACNRQPFVFRVFDNPNLVRQVAEIPMGTPGFAHNIPVMVVVVGQLRNYPEERDRHVIYIDASLAAMSFIFALESQGLSSCCINWPDVEERERRMDEFLDLARDERPVMCIAIGYPDPGGLVAYSHKKPLHLLRCYNRGE